MVQIPIVIVSRNHAGVTTKVKAWRRSDFSDLTPYFSGQSILTAITSFLFTQNSRKVLPFAGSVMRMVYCGEVGIYRANHTMALQCALAKDSCTQSF
jgi:hypothetical protein